MGDTLRGSGNHYFGAQIRTVLSRFLIEKCIVGPNLSRTLLHAFKYIFIITNDVSDIRAIFLMILLRLGRVYDTIGHRSHLVRDTLVNPYSNIIKTIVSVVKHALGQLFGAIWKK